MRKYNHIINGEAVNGPNPVSLLEIAENNDGSLDFENFDKLCDLSIAQELVVHDDGTNRVSFIRVE